MKNEETKEQINVELFRLSKGFKALTIDYQKGVLKTARGLLRIQRAYKMMLSDKTRTHGV
ncbi:MAG: hypothetical protein LBB89_08950 [Treponema sp.]|jgi:hypothetical protein|nr:hypothetical protein [Treponema sp.]